MATSPMADRMVRSAHLASRRSISDQYAQGGSAYGTFNAPDLRRVPVASVSAPRPLKHGERIVSKRDQGVVVSCADRYRFGV